MIWCSRLPSRAPLWVLEPPAADAAEEPVEESAVEEPAVEKPAVEEPAVGPGMGEPVVGTQIAEAGKS